MQITVQDKVRKLRVPKVGSHLCQVRIWHIQHTLSHGERFNHEDWSAKYRAHE